MSENYPVVSVVIPIYKVEKYLRRCIESVQMQTLKDIEIICVNDGSPDKSQEIVDELAKHDNRIVSLFQENQGLSAARNTGIKAAKGEWICFIDSDDMLGWNGQTNGNELELMMSFATDDVDAIVGNSSYVNEQGKTLADWYLNRRLGKFVPSAETLKYSNVPAWGKLYRRSVIEANDLSFPHGLKYEDNGFYPKFFAVSRGFVLTPVLFYSYFQHDDSIMADTRTNLNVENGKHYLRIIESNIKFFNEKKLFPKFLSYVQQHSWELFNDALNLSPKDAQDEIKQLFKKILLETGMDCAAHSELCQLLDSTSQAKKTNIGKVDLSFKQAKRFDRNLFQCFVDRMRRKATPRKKTLKSKALNLLMNYLGKREWERYCRNNPQVSPVGTVPLSKVFFSSQDFLNKLQHCDVVSFDIFDTLLIRKIQKPTDVFRLIESDYKEPGFARQRIYAERRARSEITAEVTLDEIYDRIPSRLKKYKEIELDYESKLLVRNDYVYQMYQAAVSAGKDVIVISDMYLPSDFLNEILKREGYEHLKCVFVSNDYRATKWSGYLYDAVIGQLGLEPKKILHVGDNSQSDIDRATSRGMQASWVPQIQSRTWEDWSKYSCHTGSLPGAIHNGLVSMYKDAPDKWEQMGYMLAGPVLVSFLLWLKDRARKNGNDRLAFVGRDGWIMHQLYSKYLDDEKLTSTYVYLPRTISLLATLTHNGAPYYLEYILKKAVKEGVVGVSPSGSVVKDEKTLLDNWDRLQKWSEGRRDQLTIHLNERLGDAQSVAFVDLTSMWLSSFSAGQSILGERVTNNYIVWLFGEIETIKVNGLPFESAINNSDGVAVMVDNPLCRDKVSVVNILESLVSSPENRVIGLQDGSPIYGDSGAKTYYMSVARGAELYFKTFLEIYGENLDLAMPMTEAIGVVSNFARTMNLSDVEMLKKVTFSAHIENEKNSKPLVS